MQQVVVVEVESNSSEIFLHEAAAKLQLGRQSQRPLIKKDIQRLDGTQVSILGEAIAIMNIVWSAKLMISLLFFVRSV